MITQEVEQVLYNLPSIANTIEEIRTSIMNSRTSENLGGRRYIKSDPTAITAIRLATNPILVYAEKTFKSVIKALSTLTRKHIQLVNLYYIRQLPIDEVLSTMNISRHEFYILKDDIIRAVSTYLIDKKH